MGKESTYNAKDTRDKGLIPGLGRPPGGGYGNLLPYSCLENPVDGDPGELRSITSQKAEHTEAIEDTLKLMLRECAFPFSSFICLLRTYFQNH